MNYSTVRVIAKENSGVDDDDIKSAFAAAKKAGVCDAQRPLKNMINNTGCKHF